ncbi:hypothetical protein M408DRAFT_232668 [Serendipita vermifera MAFF 305830]|uniref:Secreted protein n=1 Tax=Serendipita vermifera MAFF 305830 TaxID=933852 RepID=A0A0C3AZ81_SERVB|nr:hypothetical protein M408DRAFT_232668 [Serendipita vermifera MAFF 305830]
MVVGRIRKCLMVIVLCSLLTPFRLQRLQIAGGARMDVTNRPRPFRWRRDQVADGKMIRNSSIRSSRYKSRGTIRIWFSRTALPLVGGSSII